MSGAGRRTKNLEVNFLPDMEEELEREERRSTVLHMDLAEQMFEFLGNKGKVQMLMFVAACLALFGCAYTINLVSYAAPDPTTKCPSTSNPGEWEPCSEEEACKRIKDNLPAQVTFDYPNWTESYNMYCDNSGTRQLAKSLFILVNMINGVIVLFLTDIFGRKLGFYLGFLTGTSGALLGAFFPNYTVKLIGLGLGNGCNVIYSSLFTITFSELLCFTHLRTQTQNELLSSDAPLRIYLVAAMFVAFPLGSILFSSVTFWSKNSDYLALMTLGVVGVTSLFACFVMEESPMFLLGKNRFDDFITVVKTIKRRNGQDIPPQAVDAIRTAAEEWSETKAEEIRQNEKRIYQSHAFLYQVMTLSLMGGLFNIVFFGLSMNLDSLGSSNITVNGIIYSVISLVSCLIMMPFSGNMKRKLWTMLFQLGYLIDGAVLCTLSIMYKGSTSGLLKVSQTVLSAGVAGGISNAAFVPYYYYISELFPVEIRGTSYSMVQFSANLLAMISPFLVKKSADFGVHFLVGCTALVVISLPMTMFLKETIPGVGPVPTARNTAPTNLDNLSKPITMDAPRGTVAGSALTQGLTNTLLSQEMNKQKDK